MALVFAIDLERYSFFHSSFGASDFIEIIFLLYSLYFPILYLLTTRLSKLSKLVVAILVLANVTYFAIILYPSQKAIDNVNKFNIKTFKIETESTVLKIEHVEPEGTFNYLTCIKYYLSDGQEIYCNYYGLNQPMELYVDIKIGDSIIKHKNSSQGILKQLGHESRTIYFYWKRVGW